MFSFILSIFFFSPETAVKTYGCALPPTDSNDDVRCLLINNCN